MSRDIYCIFIYISILVITLLLFELFLSPQVLETNIKYVKYNTVNIHGGTGNVKSRMVKCV